jgi:cytochrome c553
MSVSRWPLAGFLLAISVSTQAADPAAVYGKGGANSAAMACVTCHGAEAEGVAAAGFPRLASIILKDSCN